MLINERKLRSIVRSVIKESLGGPDEKHRALLSLRSAIHIKSPKDRDRTPTGLNWHYPMLYVPEMSLKVLPMSSSDGCARAELIVKSATNKGSLDVCLYDDKIEIIHNDKSTGESKVYFEQEITPEQIISDGASKLASDIVRARAANWYIQVGTPYDPMNDEFADESWENMEDDYSEPPAAMQPEMIDDDDWEDDDDYDETPAFPGDYNGYLNRKYDEELAKMNSFPGRKK